MASGMAGIEGMSPEARDATKKALAELKKRGIPVNVNSGFRTHEEQQGLYSRMLAGKNKYPVAKPGHSRHESGLAVDLGIAPEHRDAANLILAGHGLHWAGHRDEVHYDYKGAGAQTQAGNQFDAQLASINQRRGEATQQFLDPVAAKYMGGGQGGGATQPPSGLVDPVAAKYMGGSSGGGFLPETPSPEEMTPAAPKPDNRNILQRATDYVSDYGYNVFNPNSGLNAFERGSYAFKPLTDLVNVGTGGLANNVLQHTLMPVRAGVQHVLQAGQQTLQDFAEKAITRFSQQELLSKAAEIDNRYRLGQATLADTQWYIENKPLIDNARRPFIDQTTFQPNSAQNTWAAMRAAFEGRPDPQPIKGGLFSAATGLDPNNPLVGIADLGTDFEFAGKFAKTFYSPVLGGAAGWGKPLAENLAQREGAVGLAGKVMKGGAFGTARLGADALNDLGWQAVKKTGRGQGVMSFLQKATSSGEDFRAAQRALVDETAFKRTAEQMHSRVLNSIVKESARMAGEGHEVAGNILEGTPYDLPELAGKLTGNIADQAMFLYNEAGGEGSFFTEPEVLKLASDHGVDPKWLTTMGDEAKALSLHAGEHLVDAGLLDKDAFTANAGNYARRLYHLTSLTQDQAATMAADLAAKGLNHTETFALVQNIAENGGGGGRFMRGGLSPTGVVRERELLTPQERLANMPDLSYSRSSTISLGRQFKAAAQQRLLNKIADPQLGMSAAGQLEEWNRGPITRQPRFVGELARLNKNIEEIKGKFTKPKGLDETQNSLAEQVKKAIKQVQHVGQEKVQHQIKEPIEPPQPQVRTPSGSAPNPRGLLTGPSSTGALPTAAQAATRRTLAQTIAQGIGKAKSVVRTSLENADLKKYASDLAEYQKQKATWTKKAARIDEHWEAAKAKLDQAKIEHDQHLQLIDQANEEQGKLIRRQTLLEGRSPSIEDASDALDGAMKKLDPTGQFPMDIATRATWLYKWRDHWTRFNDDIFSDIPPDRAPSRAGGSVPPYRAGNGAEQSLDCGSPQQYALGSGRLGLAC
jgi:hypothetical protein